MQTYQGYGSHAEGSLTLGWCEDVRVPQGVCPRDPLGSRGSSVGIHTPCPHPCPSCTLRSPYVPPVLGGAVPPPPYGVGVTSEPDDLVVGTGHPRDELLLGRGIIGEESLAPQRPVLEDEVSQSEATTLFDDLIVVLVTTQINLSHAPHLLPSSQIATMCSHSLGGILDLSLLPFSPCVPVLDPRGAEV